MAKVWPLSVAILLAVFWAAIGSAQVQIDDFQGDLRIENLRPTDPNVPPSAFTPTYGIVNRPSNDTVGGYRAYSALLTLCPGQNVAGSSIGSFTELGYLNHQSNPLACGYTRMVWDGDATPDNVNTSGLGGIDLGDPSLGWGFRVNIESADRPSSLRFKVHSGTGCSQGSIDISAPFYAPRLLTLQFASMTACPGAPAANVRSAGAIELQIDGTALHSLDLTLDLLSTGCARLNTAGNPVCPSPTATPSPTPSATATRTASPTPTATLTPTVTSTRTATPTATLIPTATPTRTATATRTPTNTPTRTATPSPSITPSLTPTRTAIPTFTATAIATFTPVRSPTTTTHIATSTPTPKSTVALTIIEGCRNYLSDDEIVLTIPASLVSATTWRTVETDCAQPEFARGPISSATGSQQRTVTVPFDPRAGLICISDKFDRVIAYAKIPGKMCSVGLRLTSLCSEQPMVTRRWRVNNPNPYSVTTDWELVAIPLRTGQIIVPAHDEFVFDTFTLAGANTLRIYSVFAQNIRALEDTKASSGATCGTITPTSTPTRIGTPTPTPTVAPTATPTVTPTLLPPPTATPTATPVEVETATPTTGPVPTRTATPTNTVLVQPTSTPTPEPASAIEPPATPTVARPPSIGQCNTSDVTSILLAMDSGAARSQAAIRSAVTTSAREHWMSQRSAKKIIDQAQRLYLAAWQHTWTLPRTIVTCGSVETCTTISLAVAQAKYRAAVEDLFRLSSDVSKTLRRYGKKAERIVKRLETTSRAARDENLKQLQRLPASTDQCT